MNNGFIAIVGTFLTTFLGAFMAIWLWVLSVSGVIRRKKFLRVTKGDAAMVQDIETYRCHCGREVAATTHPYMKESAPYLYEDLCEICISVRCDAYPDACEGIRLSEYK